MLSGGVSVVMLCCLFVVVVCCRCLMCVVGRWLRLLFVVCWLLWVVVGVVFGCRYCLAVWCCLLFSLLLDGCHLLFVGCCSSLVVCCSLLVVGCSFIVVCVLVC